MKFMKIKKLFFLLFMLQNFVFADTIDTKELKQILQKMDGVKADFSQKVLALSGEVLQTSKGSMALKRPDFFRWESNSEDPILVVADGNKFWHYDKDLKQITTQDIREHDRSSVICLLLSGNIDDMDRKYIVTKISTTHCISGANLCFEIVPKDSIYGFQQLQIGFKDDIIHSLRIWDQLGQLSEFSFSNVKLNPNLSDKLFQFIPPADVDVIG